MNGSVVVPELFAKLNRTLLITQLRAAQTYRIIVSIQGSNNEVQSKVYSVLAETQVCGNSEVMVSVALTCIALPCLVGLLKAIISCLTPCVDI